MSIVTISDLQKAYSSFQLDHVSFALETGRIAGFVGRNGAGKTTTIKAMLNMVHPDAGTIEYFGMPLCGNEVAIKQRIGYSTGSIHWYPRRKIREIAAVMREFYPGWTEGAYRQYLELFQLDEEKRVLELSEGMKVKCNLLFALSHGAEVLILDEPTSGLDPFSRDELLDIFKQIRRQGTAILFSTHIIADIEKCADSIIYISRGKIVTAMPKDEFQRSCVAEGESLEDALLRMEKAERRELYHA